MKINTLSIEPVRLAEWTYQTAGQSVIQEMMFAASQPGILSFALGMPAPELFPAEAYADATARVLSTDSRALQYGAPFQPLKTHIVSLMARRGVRCREEQVFLTTGAQQAISLLVRLLLNPGGHVLCEEKIYTGFQQAIEPFQPIISAVTTDIETGMDVERVEELLATGKRPAFIYAIPEGHNPLSTSMSQAKRVRLVELANQYGVPILEDDPYGFLCYENALLPPLRTMDDKWVFYLGSFSKMLAPAVRVGWLILPEDLIPKLSIIKESTDINTNTLAQRTISAYLDTGQFTDHLAQLSVEYKSRRDTMLDALREYFPGGTRWTNPSSGLYVWVELPVALDLKELLMKAVREEQVAFIPGEAFSIYPNTLPSRTMRLNFSNCSHENIREGIARLARVIRRSLTSQADNIGAAADFHSMSNNV